MHRLLRRWPARVAAVAALATALTWTAAAAAPPEDAGRSAPAAADTTPADTTPATHLRAAPSVAQRKTERRAERRAHRRAAKRIEGERARRITVRRVRVAAGAARSRIGSPYVWGAGGPGAFDCSGLTQWALDRAGVAIARNSFAQARQGRAVSRSRVRAGDLVFFSTAGPGASHVGIALGRHTVVSATSSGVRTHPISDAYWGAHYVGARRVISL
jgi:cell wall-associated NlpC family hydrolase